MSHLSERWLSVRLEFCSMLVVCAVCMFTALLRDQLSASLAGLAIVYSLQMCGLLQFTIRLTSQVSNYMTCVERLTEYSNQPPEAAYEIAETRPADSWPQLGRIDFRAVEMRYRPELDLVLRGISFTVEPGEAVGICGRTGAGKTDIIRWLIP
jgi:ABC-type multidrug transport system fused ATPase/permease subunit